MGRKLRREVEDLVRTEGVWNINEIKMPTAMRNTLLEELAKLGFRKAHVAEALDLCKDREEALEWLLIHVPEDDLPKWALPENYIAGVSMAGDVKKEAAVKRLASAGYAQEACQESLEECDWNEQSAAWNLQSRLMAVQVEEKVSHSLSNINLDDSKSGTNDEWQEELGVLSAIFEGRLRTISNTSCAIDVQVPDTPVVEVQVHIGKRSYPHTLPIVKITGQLPSYLKLSITQKVLLQAAKEFLGEPMIFNIIDWLELNIGETISNPGCLADLAGANISVRSQQSLPSVPRKKLKCHHPQPLTKNHTTAANFALFATWQTKQASAAQQKMLSSRRMLPAWQKRDAIVKAVESKQVTIISGATGSGKSTQAVQFILDDLIERHAGASTKIVCTQPRRISALGLADRVSDERCGTVGDEVGYAIRGESKQGKNTRITFCTTGVLLRRLQTSGGNRDDLVKSIADISHVVVDEVHERSLDTDFLLALLRDIIQIRKDLKVILMSATLDANVFERYFGGPNKVSKIEIEGRTFPVEDFYLDHVVQATGFRGDRAIEDELSEPAARDMSTSKAIQSIGFGINYQLIASLVRQIDAELGAETGGILIFLPGTLEITRTIVALHSIPNLHALPLHASLLSAEQRRVFPPAPLGKRKVIAATNVAETSITIPDIVAVIDTGRVKETQYDPVSSIVKLVEVWASKAACQQRRGRAGRVTAGKCYKLFTKQAEQQRMPDKPEPEIRRTPLEQLCLSVKAMGVDDVPKFLSETITPPESVAVEGAIKLLHRMAALDGDVLTALGQHMATIPADLRCSKMMILGALFGCLDVCVIIASILTVKSPFVAPQDKRDEARAIREGFGKGQNMGDLIIDLNAFTEWNHMVSDKRPFREVKNWCQDHFLSQQTLQDIQSTRQQYLASLQETGFLPNSSFSAPKTTETLNRNSDSLQLLGAIILASLSPQTLRILYPPTKYTATSTGNLPLDPAAKSIQFFDEANQRVFIHPSSTLFSAQGYSGNPGFMSYWNKVATSKVFARELCPAGTFAVLLFAGEGLEVDKLGRGVIVDGWMRVRGWARIGVLVGRLRNVIDMHLRDWFEQPEMIGNESQNGIVDLVKRLVELDGLDQ